jgi:hypothetical protein
MSVHYVESMNAVPAYGLEGNRRCEMHPTFVRYHHWTIPTHHRSSEATWCDFPYSGFVSLKESEINALLEAAFDPTTNQWGKKSEVWPFTEKSDQMAFMEEIRVRANLRPSKQRQTFFENWRGVPFTMIVISTIGLLTMLALGKDFMNLHTRKIRGGSRWPEDLATKVGQTLGIPGTVAAIAIVAVIVTFFAYRRWNSQRDREFLVLVR